MTNKKLKFAVMSVALTACVAAQPLAANAAENLRPVADDPAPEQNEPSQASSSSEETVEEIKNETLNPDPEPSEDMDVKEAFGDDVDIKYDPDKATKDEETGTVTTPGDVIRKEDPDQPGETEETDKTGETDPSGSTDETGKTGETDGSEEAGEVIGSAERNETDESSSNTVTPDPGAPSTPSGPSVSGTDEDGNTTITTPTPEDPDLPAPDDETPVVTPETPELPPVQDAAPDAEPTTDVVITPATPELPPVQDAAPDVISALPKTGVNWTAAIGMALSGMALMAAGAFTSLFHKAKH